MTYRTIEIEFDTATQWNDFKVQHWFNDMDVTFMELRECYPTRVVCNYNDESIMVSDIFDQFRDMAYTPLRWRHYGNPVWIEIIT